MDWLRSADVAEKEEGEFRIDARKMFSSGCPARGMLVTSAVYDAVQAGPTVRHFSVPFKGDGTKILDTWRVIGMRGTGRAVPRVRVRFERYNDSGVEGLTDRSRPHRQTQSTSIAASSDRRYDKNKATTSGADRLRQMQLFRIVMRSVRRSVTTITLLGAVVALGVAMHAGAQKYPLRPVRIVAPSINTTADLVARIIGPRLAEKWDQPVIVDNRSGGPAATLPATIVRKASADGYTLLMGETSSLAGAVSLLKKLEYDPSRDFAPITLVARAPFVLVVHASMPATLREFIAHAKKQPGALSYASAATGSISHLSTALLLRLTGIQAVHVPYRGAGAATFAIAAGEVQFGSITLSSAMSQLSTAKVRALAIASKHRVERGPVADVPTAVEAGLSGFESEAWYGLLAPAGAPAAVVKNLNSHIVSILMEPAMRQRIVALGAEPQPGTPDEFRQLIREETDKWRRVIRAADIRLE